MLRLAISSAVLRPLDDITITVSRREENKTSDFSYMGIFVWNITGIIRVSTNYTNNIPITPLPTTRTRDAIMLIQVYNQNEFRKLHSNILLYSILLYTLFVDLSFDLPTTPSFFYVRNQTIKAQK